RGGRRPSGAGRAPPGSSGRGPGVRIAPGGPGPAVRADRAGPTKVRRHVPGGGPDDGPTASPGGGRVPPAARPTGQPLSRLRKSCSSIVSTPSWRALSYFDPGFSPTTTKSVFLETLEATRAPASRAACSASDRDIDTRPPVMTTVLPVRGPSGSGS